MKVLILVVVDNGLVPLSVTIERYEDGVLILVVVDNGLVRAADLKKQFEELKS